MIKNLKIYKQATALLLSATCLMTAGCSSNKTNNDSNLGTNSSYCEDPNLETNSSYCEDPNLETNSSYCEIAPETPDISITENDTQQDTQDDTQQDNMITPEEFNLENQNLTQEELETLNQLMKLSKTITKGKETAKQALRDLTDFFFNSKEINGVTFEELSDNAKAIAIKCFETIVTAVKGADAAIEERYPNYKQELLKKAGEFTGNVLNGIVDISKFLFEKGKDVAGDVKNYIDEGKVLTK